MAALQKPRQTEDFFSPLGRRENRGSYAARFIGYDDKGLDFLSRYYSQAKKKGLYLAASLANPGEDEVDFYYQSVPEGFQLSAGYVENSVKKWFSTSLQNKTAPLERALLENLNLLSSTGSNENMLKNAFVKYMCWLKKYFEPVIGSLGEEEPPKILYEGNMGKYEFYLLIMLAQSGADLLIVNFQSEDNYLKYDPKGQYTAGFYGAGRGTPPTHFTQMAQENLKAMEQVQRAKAQAQAVGDPVDTNQWLTGSFLEALPLSNSARGLGNNRRIHNLFVRYIGADEEAAYCNRLFQMRRSIIEAKKPYVLVEGKMPNPTIEEVNHVKRPQFQDREKIISFLSAQIQVTEDTVAQALVIRAFSEALWEDGETHPAKLVNLGVRTLCWVRRYCGQLFARFTSENLPVFIFFGKCTQAEGVFMNMVSKMAADVLYICPDKSGDKVFEDPAVAGESILEELPQSLTLEKFPQTEIKVRVATAAYNAERDLDHILYEGTGLFRNRQFTFSSTVTLKTTYDEIGLLWKEEAKYRPSFQAEQGHVTVPNIFAKICGVENGDENAYFKKIGSMITEKTIFIPKLPYIEPTSPNPLRNVAFRYLRNGKLLPEMIKKDSRYRYDYLSEDTQDYILDKIQELLDLHWIKSDAMGVENTIVATLLNLDKNTIRLIQQFDFTKEIPKVLIVNTGESMTSLEDCITFLFLNLVGFDIAVFTPTGYRNIEKFISREAFEEYTIGEYLFNLRLPNLSKIQPSSGQGTFFNRLFGKGRN